MKHFLTVREYAKETHYSERHVRRLIAEGQIIAQKVGRRYQIPVDQSKDAKVTYHHTASGIKVRIPPIAPKGLIWDMSKNRFVSIQDYAQERGHSVVTVDGRKMVKIRFQSPES